jgi:hypothetical protein
MAVYEQEGDHEPDARLEMVIKEGHNPCRY